MGTEPNSIIEWSNALLDSNIAKFLLLPLGYGLFRLIEYLLKRKVEGSGASRDMASLHSAADLREKLARQNMDLDQLKDFRRQALGQSAQSAVNTAQHYIERAELLTTNVDLDTSDTWPVAITQADMNRQAAAQFAAADDELTALILERMAGLSVDEAAAFQRSQDIWRAWRNAEAEWDSKVWEGGSIRPLMVSTKMEQITRERIASIQLSGNLERDPNATFIPYRRAPIDLPEHIEPGITATRVREILNVPHYISGERWYYRFQEVQLELGLAGEVVQEVSFAIVEGETYEASLGGFENLRFGEVTFGDLLELQPQLQFTHRITARTAEIYAVVRIGPPGAWSDFYFGALVPYHGGGKLMHTEFEWDRETDTLKSLPTDTRINWFGQTHDFDNEPGISWFLR